MIVTAATITKLPPTRGAVLVTGSHGGRYCGRLAVRASARAVIFHDAGIGRDDAGVASLALLGALGIAAAAVSHATSRIGDAEDMMLRGRISRLNEHAADLGVAQDMPCAEAAARLETATHVDADAWAAVEARVVERPRDARRPLVLIDSASLVDPVADRGAVVASGSHGGLVGGAAAMALQAAAFAAAYNDAGRGIDDAGIARLAPLDERGIAAITVSAGSARIGEARSTFEDGIVSAVNARAAALGAAVGASARDVLLAFARMGDEA